MHSPRWDKALVLSDLLSGQRSKSAGQSLQPSHLQSWEEEGKEADKARLHNQMGSCCMHMGPGWHRISVSHPKRGRTSVQCTLHCSASAARR